MHAGWKVRWASMLMTSHSQSLETRQMEGYQALQKQNMEKGETQREKINKHSKQYFIWIGLLLIELPKLVGVGNCFIRIFAVWQHIWYQMTATHSLHNLINLPSRTERLPAKIRLAVASDSAGQLALTNNPGSSLHIEEGMKLMFQALALCLSKSAMTRANALHVSLVIISWP